MAATIKKHVIKVPIYGVIINVWMGPDDDSEWIKWIYENEEERRNYNYETILQSSNCVFVEEAHNNYQEIVMLLKTYTPGVLAHEIKHAVNGIFKYCGVELDVNNDEAECYLVGWLTDEIYKILNKV